MKQEEFLKIIRNLFLLSVNVREIEGEREKNRKIRISGNWEEQIGTNKLAHISKPILRSKALTFTSFFPHTGLKCSFSRLFIHLFI